MIVDITLALGTSAAAAMGTWVIGIIGGAIAYQQLLNNSFRPAAKSWREEGWSDPNKDRRVIVVRIHNRGGADGMIERVDVVGPGHEDLREVIFKNWKGDRPPVPFILPGHASAVLVLSPADGNQFSTSDRVLLTFNLGKKQLCVEMQVERKNLERMKNIIPPGSMPVTSQSENPER